MIHQATIDRAVAALLDIAEDDGATVEERVTAAAQVVGLAAMGPMGEPPDADADELAAAFRAGAAWRKEHPRAKLPGELTMLELAYAAPR